MTQPSEATRIPSPLVALAGWIIPGAGYWLLGQRARAMIVLGSVVTLYVLGLLIGGMRVIEVPGYDASGNQIQAPRGQWVITHGGLLSEIAAKPWFVGQILAGPMCIASAAGSIQLAHHAQMYPRSHAPLDTIGTLYTAIAGMLNLMVIIDSAYRAGSPEAGFGEAG